NLFQITDDELAKMGTIISEPEKSRRHTERERKRRRDQGAVAREKYDEKRSKASQTKREKALAMKDQGLKNKAIAEALGIHVKSVSRLLKG
ncbi:MAG: helix-turn-helix domain-containing protein, partial [Endozoicomonas sp.]